MSGKANNAGIYNFDNLNAQTLYIKGKRFEDYVAELIVDDQFEQSEIDELKLLLEYLDTTGLNTAWAVTNSNVNETLRSAITALQNKLANIDTTGLTQSSALTDDNRNSVLKTAIDTATSDLTALTTRMTTAEGDIDSLETRMTTAEGDIDSLETRMTTAESDIDILETRETASETNITGILAKTKYIEVNDGDPDDDESVNAIGFGSNMLSQANTAAHKSVTLGVGLVGHGFAAEYKLNEIQRVAMSAEFGGEAIIRAQTTTLQGGVVNIGELQEGGGYETINIGAKMSHINIGSLQNPEIATYVGDPAANNSTKIYIGKNATLKNTWTYLAGNFYTSESRWEDLAVTDMVTFETAASWFAGYVFSGGLPYWLAWVGLSGTPIYRYSDVVKMANNYLTGGLTKNHAIETSNDLSVQNIRVMDFTVVSLSTAFDAILARLVFQAFAVHGSHSIGSIWGRTNIYAGSGEVEIRVDGGAFDWALKNAGNCNRVFLDNDHVEVVQCNGSGGTGRLRLVAANGNIELSTAQGGVRSYATKVMELTHLKQIIIGDDTSMTDTTYKMLIDTTSHTNGIKVAKGSNALLLNPDNVSSKSLTLQSVYTGTTANTLYKNADDKLMWNGAEVGASGVSSGGITYMVNVPSNISNPAPSPTETIMTAAYSGNPQRTITQAITSNSAFYIAKYTTEVFDEASNPVLTGLQQLNQYISWNSQNQVGQLYGRLWFQATAVGSATLYQRTYASPVTTTAATFINGTPIPTPKGLYNIKFQRVVFPNINVVVSSGPVVLRFRVEGYDFFNGWVTITNVNPAGTGQSVSTSTNNLSVSLDEGYDLSQTSSIGAKTALRVVLYIDSGTGTIAQTSAGGADLAAYSIIAVGSNIPGLFRTMLYDGTNAKVVTPYSTTPTLVEYDLPIDAPYNVSAFASPTLSTDLYFIQPVGVIVANHVITLYFNEDSISHYHSTISPTQTTPTLAQVLNSGATASQDINMNSHKISGITTLEGSSNGNWNVKEITTPGGSGISVTPTNGSYSIANSGVISVAAAGGTPGITATTSNGAVTLQNSGVISVDAASVSAGITATTTNGAVTLQNSGIITINQGTGISVTTTNGVATITNTASAGGQVARDQLSATSSVGLVPNKLSHYAQNWATQSVSVLPKDIFVSHDGRNCVYIPWSFPGSYVQYSFDYGVTWTNSNLVAAYFTSICGSMTGEVLYITHIESASTGQAPNTIFTSRIYASYNYGVSWTELTLNRTSGAANTWYNRFVDKIRCSSDGSVVMVSTQHTTPATGVANNGVVYISTNTAATWVVLNITAGASHIIDCCMSANGAIMFAAADGVLGGSTDNGNGGIYRSYDFGATWTKVRNQISAGAYYFGVIKCDATGRFLLACDQTMSTSAGGGQVQTSDDYGSNWTWFGDALARGATAAFVSQGGNLMITLHNPTYHSRFRYSTNYGRTWYDAFSWYPGAATFEKIASNHDGSVLLVSNGSDAAIYRSVEERGKLQLTTTSGELTMTPAFGGGYTFVNNPTTTLWYSGGFEVPTSATAHKVDFDFLSAGKIDLTQYNIRYEIDCYWSTGTWSYTFPLLSINDVLDTAVQGTNPNISHDPLASLTNWTNNINNGTFGGVAVYTQTYNNRFFAGYFPGSSTNTQAGANAQQRQKSLIKGTLSLHRRPAAQTGITDASINAKDIYNVFTCDNYSARFYSGMLYLMNSNAQQGIDYGINHQRINGTGIFAAESVWSSTPMGAGTAMTSGVSRIGFHMSEGGSTTTHRPRAAHYTYRIYRERK